MKENGEKRGKKKEERRKGRRGREEKKKGEEFSKMTRIQRKKQLNQRRV